MDYPDYVATVAELKEWAGFLEQGQATLALAEANTHPNVEAYRRDFALKVRTVIREMRELFERLPPKPSWFICYGYRRCGATTWQYTEAVTQEHPVEFLVRQRRDYGERSEFYIATALEIR